MVDSAPGNDMRGEVVKRIQFINVGSQPTLGGTRQSLASAAYFSNAESKRRWEGSMEPVAQALVAWVMRLRLFFPTNPN